MMIKLNCRETTPRRQGAQDNLLISERQGGRASAQPLNYAADG